MVFSMKRTSEEFLNVTCIKHLELTESFLRPPPGFYEVADKNKTLKNTLPTKLAYGIRNDDEVRTNLFFYKLQELGINV